MEADCEALNDNSSNDSIGYPHWSGEPCELVVETSFAMRVRGDHADDCIAIDSDSDMKTDPIEDTAVVVTS